MKITNTQKILIFITIIVIFLYLVKRNSDSIEDKKSGKKGCTSEGATNYDPTATEDDGSCTYAPQGLQCDACVNGYPVTQLYPNYKTCPIDTIPSGTGDPCALITSGNDTPVSVNDTPLNPAPATGVNTNSSGIVGTTTNALNEKPPTVSGLQPTGTGSTNISTQDFSTFGCCNPLSPNFDPSCPSNSMCNCVNYLC
tara:strand:- start:133 stop:723 length:591 start_codon:yes stop_codon:yes gene_type:complete